MGTRYNFDWPSVDDGWEYARRVVAGDIVAGKWITLACEKSLRELEDPNYYWSFDEAKAQDVIDFCYFVPHVQGELAGKPTRPNPWQVWLLSNMFGWYKGDKRRYRQIIAEVARKNGKSFICSLFAIYELLMGDEGAEIYSVATKRDQAKKVWNDAVQMSKKMDGRVARKFKSTVTNLFVEDRYSKYTAVGRDSDTLDGLNPSMVIIDEAAAIKDRNLIEVMESALGGRLNPMMIYITTAQPTKETAYYEKRLYSQQVLEGKIPLEPERDTMLSVIYCIDEDDDWTDESCWAKANPNLEFLPTISDTIREGVQEATSIPSKKNNVLVKHFNVYSNTSAGWLDTLTWEKSYVEELKREGQLFMGMDLAQTNDLTACARLWSAGQEFHADFRCWIPRWRMKDLPVHTSSLYNQAVESKVLFLTEGPVTDYDQVEGYIDQTAIEFDLQGIGYDDYNAMQLVTKLENKGLNLLRVGQSIGALSAPSKETERHILDGLIRHDGNPFITWQLSNCEAYRDVNENLKIRKGDDGSLKIDAIIALIMAMSLGAGNLEQPQQGDVWFL